MLQIGENIGWDHGEAQVFRAYWQGRPVILKRHRKPKNYLREVYGYHVWKQHLPELLFTRSEHLELVLSEESGECALDLLSTEKLYQSAGVVLRQMHDTAPLSVPFSDGRGDLLDQINRYIPRAAGLLSASQIINIEAKTRELLNNALPCPVLRHGDYTARNWLWDGTKLTAIDLEHARPGPAVLDIAKLNNAMLTQHPALRAAFQEGYGREWSEEEQHFLHVIRQFDALTLAVWCHEHADWNGVQRMRTVLEGLAS